MPFNGDPRSEFQFHLHGNHARAAMDRSIRKKLFCSAQKLHPTFQPKAADARAEGDGVLAQYLAAAQR